MRCLKDANKDDDAWNAIKNDIKNCLLKIIS